MKRWRIRNYVLLCLFLVCGTLVAWDINGRLLEIKTGNFRPYDIATTNDGVCWLTYHEPAEDVGQILRISPMSYPAIYTYPDPAQFQTLDVASDNTLWITDVLDRIVHFFPGNGSFTGYPLDPAVFTLPARPFGVTAAPDGSVWFTCWQDLCLGRLDPATGDFERFAPQPAGVLPATPVEIAFDHTGCVWFTMRGPVGPPGLGKYDPVADDFTMWFDADFISPFGIIFLGGEVWFLDHHANLLVRHNTTTYVQTKIPVPPHLVDAHFLVADTDGMIWFTAFVSSALGLYDPASDSFAHVELGEATASPMGIAMGKSGFIACAETYSPGEGGIGYFYVEPQAGFFSPRTTTTHHNVYVRDGDVAVIETETLNMGLLFRGLHFDIHSLNAVDLVRHPETGTPRMFASLRDDRLLYSQQSGFIYVKKNDLLVMEVLSGALHVAFRGDDYNVPGIDAVSVFDNGDVLLSVDESFYYSGYPAGVPFYAHDGDVLLFRPETNELELMWQFSIFGLTSLDALKFTGLKIYFSVRDPIYINAFPGTGPVYAEDGDVLGLDLIDSQLELVSKGADLNIYDLDALSLSPKKPLGIVTRKGGDPEGPSFR